MDSVRLSHIEMPLDGRERGAREAIKRNESLSLGSDKRRFRLAIDIGGTFTDGILVEEDTGNTFIDKVLTTQSDPSEGFIHCLKRLTDRIDINPEQLYSIAHASTVATNAVLERRGARTALLVTSGFRDILEIARQIRYELYNLQTDKPVPLIPRRLCLDIPERLDFRGQVLTPLDESAVAKAVETFRSENVESIAICFLHSYQNPVHELKAAEIVRRLYPGVKVSLSSEIAPEIREYWRASTTVINAYVGPAISTYLGAIEEKVQSSGVTTDVHIMQSSGGIMTMTSAKERPVYMLESGPAAGVIAAAHFAKLAGFSNAISFDMGGTTAKMGLILQGQPNVVSEFEAGGVSGSGIGVARGSGYPLLVPVIDLVEIGAGGGSLAWIDSGNLMRVGPRSAGADPGPVCYGRGGSKPTVTDANLLLGRLNPKYFLGGEISLNTEAALAAVEKECARPLGMDAVTAAMGIIDIANATMVEAMRLVSVQRGYDPREFSLVTSGGAGPVHANQLADELGIPVVVVPPSPGVASAFGMLVSDLRHDYRVTRLQPLAYSRVDELNTLYDNFESKALVDLSNEGVHQSEIVITKYLDMRYVGQSWNLRIDLPGNTLTKTDLPKLKEAFDKHHTQSYGHCAPEEPVEIVNIGLLAIGKMTRPRLKDIPPDNSSPSPVKRSSRRVYFRESGGFIECPVFDRYGLRAKNIIEGPAIIEEVDSTTVVHPGYIAEVISYGMLLLRRSN